ncbi:MAG: GNAT family N-acetyltransferase [Deltaproteobacteria bacterium]|nr:GNAT family N-acetyltransferase [Deltaproteobacteria bacterium]
MSVEYQTDVSTPEDVAEHLAACDSSFSPRLSTRVNIEAYAQKLVDRAKRFEAWSGGTVVGLVAAYCNDHVARRAFITSVSVLPTWMGHGIGSELMKRCLAYVAAAGMREVCLEVARTDARAVGLYARSGFVQEPSEAGPLVVMTLRLPT